MHECCNILFNYINRLTLMTEQGAKKHKLKDETRSFQPRWENGYFVTHNNGKLQCFVCMQVLSVPKEFNLNRYYTSLHADKLKNTKTVPELHCWKTMRKTVSDKGAKTDIPNLTVSYKIL